VRWYVDHLGCQRIADRTDAAQCGTVELMFVVQPAMGSTQGTGVNHIAFSVADLPAKMAALEKIGVRGIGIRFQRFEDGATFRDAPGLFKYGFIFDPWGTRIELVEDAEALGFHHIHLSAADPAATLKWYQGALGGTPASLKGRVNGLRFGNVWLLVARHEEGTPATTTGRAIDHIAFVVKGLDDASADLRKQRVTFVEQPAVPPGGRSAAKRALLAAPDSVSVEVVEPGFAGVKVDSAPAAVTTERREPYTAPRTPWGEPDLQGLYTGNSAHGIPLERPKDLADVQALTPEQAAARRERGTLGSIWGYEREWRDTTLGYVKTAPSTQVAMIVDPPDGRLPPMTPEGPKRVEEARRQSATEESPSGALTGDRIYGGPEDLSPFVRCITRGLPGMMLPGVYNNGLQITQGPGFVTIQKEMIHETRVIPTTPRERPGPKLTSWLGTSQGRWEGDTLVVETTNFNGRMPYLGATAKMKLTERYTRIGPNALEYRFTIDDPAIWTKPWTAMFVFDKDDEQYELVEYACHEANYGMTNILSGSRAMEKAKGTRGATR
jgi:catechol 2,3-dioxygenase-like lactoylglutathione lyase family enzyme